MTPIGAPTRSDPTAHDWTRGAPKVAAALALLTLCGAAAALSLTRRSAAPTTPTASTALSALRIDLNSATSAELESLPSIGPKRAAAIIADRADRGPFRSVDDLDRVPGIGTRTIDRIRRFVRVAPPTDAPSR